MTDPAPAHVTPAPDAPNAATRLRAFEDKVLGPDTPRHGPGDGIERGIGAPITGLSPDLQKRHALHVALVAAEKKHHDTETALLAAEAADDAAGDAHEKAEAALTEAEEGPKPGEPHSVAAPHAAEPQPAPAPEHEPLLAHTLNEPV
jgi:hypothetical protein